MDFTGRRIADMTRPEVREAVEQGWASSCPPRRPSSMAPYLPLATADNGKLLWDEIVPSCSRASSLNSVLEFMFKGSVWGG